MAVAKIFTPKGGKPTTLEIEGLKTLESVQVRANGTDQDYAEELAELLKAGKKLARVKVMRVAADPKMNSTGRTGDFVFDGIHTVKAHKIAGKKVAQALLFKGTYDELIQAAAQSNAEHEESGRRLTRADKKRAVMMMATAFASIPDKDRPSYQSIAKAVRVSHTFVNNINPYGRQKDESKSRTTPKTPDVSEAEDDQGEADVGIGADGRGTPKPSANSKPGAVATPANAKLFDWTAYEADLGRVARGLAAMGDTYALKNSAEYAACYNAIDIVGGHFKKWREKHGKK